MRYILVLISIVLFSGCTTIVPAVTEYRIISNTPAVAKDGRSCKDKSLKVVQAFSSSSLMSHNMNYAQGDLKQYSYSQSEWSESPNVAITNEILKHIRVSQLFKTVLNSKSRSKSDLILEINIEDFMQYFNEDSTSSYSSVVIDLTLLDSKTGSSVATDVFSSRVDVKSLDAEGGVEALNLALQKVIAKSVVWLDGVCK